MLWNIENTYDYMAQSAYREGCRIVVGDSPMTRIMDLPKENINQELSW